jgi:hypothetical protein
MSFFTTIYIVTIEKLDQTLQSRAWYWDRTEANDKYNEAVDEYEDTRIVTVYSIDMQGTIEEKITQFMANRHSSVNRPPLDELRSSRKAEKPAVEYTPLVVTAEGTGLYIERSMAGEYWAYALSKRFRNTWTVREMDGTRVGAIYLIDPEGLMPQYQYERFEEGRNAPLKATFPALQQAAEALIEVYHQQ